MKASLFQYVTFRLPILILLVFVLPGITTVNGQEFGRFFTTSSQRERLDALRKTGPRIVVEINDDELGLDSGETEDTGPPVNAVSVKGVVHRQDGANTAWVNDSNTYEGDFASQYIQVNESDIQEDKVEMRISGSKSGVRLKVGQTYDPATGRVLDITRESVKTDSADSD